jgi:hypothetical protein
MRRIRSFGTSNKGLYDWMVRRPRLGYGDPTYKAGKTGSGLHKMALTFSGRTALSLYQR